MSSNGSSSTLGSAAARKLANTTKTIPQMESVTPRWLLRLLPWVDVEAGTYRVNRVRAIGGALERVDTSMEAGEASLDPTTLSAVPLLRNLDEEMLDRLAGMFRTEHHPPGSVILSGDAPLEPLIREAVDRMIDSWIDDGQCEFVSRFAIPAPLTLTVQQPARARARMSGSVSSSSTAR